MAEEIIFWRRTDVPGHESARLVYHEPFWQLGGTAVFADQGKACRLEYTVTCDAAWRTLHVDVGGWIGGRRVRFTLAVNAHRGWQANGQTCTDVAGCLDVDLAFTAATNMLPIRRLALEPGREAAVRAAWVSFPGLAVETLDQMYRRTGASTYRYEADGGAFVTELEVNQAGFVTRYPGRCEEETVPVSRA